MPESSTDRFVDGVVYYPTGSAPPPNSVGVLLTRLHVRHANAGAKEEAIREWLESNVPSPALVRSLENRGYRHLVPTPHAS